MAALARRLGVPFRSGGNLCASKVADAQAAYESGGHVPADDPRRRQLRAPRRGLAGGRPRDRLREVHPRRRPVRDDGRLREGRGPVRERPGARRDPRRTGPASTSSARRTRWPTSRPRSTAARSPTTTASSSGRRTARSMPPSGRTRSGSGCCASTRRRRSTPAIDEALLEFIAKRKASMPDSEV